MELEKLRDVDWVAKLIGTSRERVYQLAREGSIPVVRVGERRLRFDPHAVADWIRAGGTSQRERDAG